MSKRKIQTEVSSETIAANLKKPRNEISKYSLFSVLTSSKQQTLDENDESCSNLAFATDKTNEINFLLGHISDGNAAEIEKFLKKCIKEERQRQRGSHSFSATHSCLKATFQFALENSDALSATVAEKLSRCFSKSKLEILGDVCLNEYLEMFAEHTVKTNKIDPKISSIVTVIAKHVTAATDNFVYLMFYRVLNACIRPADQTLLVELLRIFDSVYKQDMDGDALAAFIFSTLFNLKAIPQKHPSLQTDLNISWSVKGLRHLISTISLDKYHHKFMPKLYEALIDCVVDCRKSLTEKAEYLKLESEAIARLTKDQTRTDSKKKRQEACLAFRQAFVAKMKMSSHRLVLDRFFVNLYLASLDCMEASCELNRGFVEGMKELFERDLHTSKAGWMESCAKVKNPVDELNNLFTYKRLVMVVGAAVVQRSILSLCTYILDECVKVEVASSVTVASNTSEFFSQFVTRLLTQMFVQTSKKKIDTSICLHLFDRCLSSDKERVYSDQLALFLNNEQVSVIMADQASPELDKLRKKMIDRLLTRSISRSVALKHTTAIPRHFHAFTSYKSAVRLLDTCRSIFVSAKPKYLAELINYLATCSTPSSTDDQKRFSVHGLLSLLKSINSTRKDTEESLRLSNVILDSLRAFINRQECTSHNKQHQGAVLAELKSEIYQSFHSIIGLNSNLVKPVIGLLLDQLKKVLKTTTHGKFLNIDLAKCISAYDSHLTEPVDVLLHVSDLCTRRALSLTHNEPLSKLRALINGVVATYETTSPSTMLDLYKSQMAHAHARTMPLLHKLIMGLIDVLIEHVITEQKYTSIGQMLEHYEGTSSLVSSDIEAALASSTASPKPDLKRKKLDRPAQLIKKLCNFKATQATEPSTSSSTAKTGRRPFTDLTNTITPKAQPVQQQAPTDKSYINIQFTYVPRISYTCCVRLAQLIQCSDPTDLTDMPRIFSDNASRAALINLVTNKKFADYVIKLVERKLKALMATQTGTDDDQRVYDPESLTGEQVFDLFLSKLWSNFCQRLNGTVNETGQSAFTATSRHQLSHAFFAKSLKFISFCQTIWRLVQTRFRASLCALLLKERSIYATNLPSFDTNETSLVHQLTWQFILNCARTVKLYLSPSGPKQAYASKCCSGMFSLMLDIVRTVDLTHSEYTQLNQWLCGLASESIACDGEAYKTIINLMVYLEGKHSSQAIILKSLLMDYGQYMKLMNSDEDEEEEDDESMRSVVETTNMVQQFQLVGAFNTSEYARFVLEKVVDLLAEVRWVVAGGGRGFVRERMLAMVVRQMAAVAMSLEAVLRLVFNLEAVGCVVQTLIVFYECVGLLLESPLVSGMSLDEIDSVKFLIGCITKNVHNVLSDEWPIIRELIISEEEFHEEKVNANDFERFARYKRLISDLEAAVTGFEKAVYKLNNQFKDVNILEEYKSLANSLELNFNCKVTRTISVSQMEQSWSSQCSGSQNRHES